MVLETRSEAACFPVSNGEIPGARAKYTWRSIQKWLIVNNLAAGAVRVLKLKAKRTRAKEKKISKKKKISLGLVNSLTFPFKESS